MRLHKIAANDYLPADSVVAERIAAIYPDLSEALRRFADFVLNEPMQVAQMSINETVSASGVSVATANRFARKLSFEGYAQFRAEVIQSFESVFAPVERLRTKLSEGSSTHQVVTASMDEDLENLRDTMRNLDAARCEQACSMIAQAERMFIVAFDSGAALATIFAHHLRLAGRSAAIVDNGGGALTAARHLATFGKSDLVVAIAFPRYIRETVELTRAAVKHAIPVLSITDTQASPLASLGTLTLYVHARRSFSSTSNTAILALLEALAAGVASQTDGAAETAERFADFAYPWLISPGRGPGRS
ncbi:MurR/RpiR family transcriptional regulator [Consotaella aegiceratis]|uniref:MurR/RpiR family transcriptional regulator n=1 Tax=Consotaella aegiceratis TaxID=3097961 RepID=UPI002F430150